MKKSGKNLLAVMSVTVACIAAALFYPGHGEDRSAGTTWAAALTDSVALIVADCPGDVGVALIVNDEDTFTVDNGNVYPMMSVFKVHQALAVCRALDRRGITLDTVLAIRRDALDSGTWSPMMKEHPEEVMELSVGELLRYTLAMSDNNASNLMFGRLVGVEETDSLIATIIPRQSFSIACTEEEMSADHGKARANRTSPLGAAALMNRIFTDSLVSGAKQDFIRRTLAGCRTGADRIVVPLLGRAGVEVAHKTGSGYRDADGILAAHNDVAYVRLPNGTRYSLAIFVKDFRGSEEDASRYMARISAAVYSLLSRT